MKTVLISNMRVYSRILKIHAYTALNAVVNLLGLRNCYGSGLVVVCLGCFGIRAFELVGIIIRVNFHGYSVGKPDLIAECEKWRGFTIDGEVQVVIGIIIVSGLVILDSYRGG